MFRNIKRIYEMNQTITKEAEEYDDDGRLIINLRVKDDTNFLSVFSYSKEAVLSTEVATFLTNGINPKHYRHDLHIKIHSTVVDPQEEVLYSAAIKRHFEKEFLKAQHNVRRDLILSSIMLLCGIFFLLFMFICDYNNADAIILEIVDIFAWVFLWESADLFFLQRNLNKIEQQKNISFAKAKITYHQLSSEI